MLPEGRLHFLLRRASTVTAGAATILLLRDVQLQILQPSNATEVKPLCRKPPAAPLAETFEGCTAARLLAFGSMKAVTVGPSSLYHEAIIVTLLVTINFRCISSVPLENSA